MFQKLKIRMTLVNVSVISIVLIIIFSSLYMLNKSSMEHQSDKLMLNVASRERIMFQPQAPKDSSHQSESLGPRRISSDIFYIRTDFIGEIINYSNNLNMEKKDISEISSKAFKSSDQKGVLKYNNMTLSYLRVPKDYGYILVFYDKNPEIETLNRLIISSITIGGISLILVIIISLFLASKAIVPIKKAWEKQKAFVADASHELRTPLAVINTNLEVVMGNGEEDVNSQSKWLENMHMEINRMAKLVEDLLFLARADSNEECIPKLRFEISNALKETIVPFEPLVNEKGITLNREIQPYITFYGNEGRIKQLVTILIDNAIKHTPTGGNVNVKMICGEHNIEIMVSDNGEGIPKEHMDKIFERFYKIDKSRSKNYEGSGLGLSIADCIVREHRGSIAVASTVGKGSTFKIILPK